MDEVNAAVEALEKERRRTRGIVAVHVAVYAAALVLFVFGRWVPAMIVLGVNLPAYFLVVRRATGGYARAATEENLRFGLCAGLEDMTYRAKSGMTQADLEEWAMLPIKGKGDGLLSRQFVSARKGDMELTCSEVTFHYMAVGAKGREEQRFLSGSLLTGRRTAGERQGDWLLLRQSLLDPAVRDAFVRDNGYAEVQGAPEGFALYARGAQAQPSEALARRLAGLCGEMKSLGALRLTKDGAAAYLNMRFYTGNAHPTARPDAARLRENTLPERDGLWDLFQSWLSTGGA